MLAQTNRRKIGVALLAVLAVALMVTPATASSKLDEPPCEDQRALVVRTQGAESAVVAELQVDRAALRRAAEAAQARAARAFERQRAVVNRAVVALPELDELEIAFVIDELERGGIRDRGFDKPEISGWEYDFGWHEHGADPRSSHPLSAGIDVLVDLAKLPSQAAMVAQHLMEAFAKVTPRVLRSIL